MQKQMDNGNINIVNREPEYYDYIDIKYDEYKKGVLLPEELNEREKKEIEVLKVLDQLNYPMNQTGTYFYKEVILNLVESFEYDLTADDYHYLLSALDHDYSQFYFDISKSYYAISLATFHGCINLAFKNNNRIPMNTINNYFPPTTNYKEEAVNIASYITKKKKKTQNNPVKSFVI